MTDYQRRLIFEVCQDEDVCLPVVHKIFSYVHCDIFFAWLKYHGYIGLNLINFVDEKFAGSVPEMVKYIMNDLKKAGT